MKSSLCGISYGKSSLTYSPSLPFSRTVGSTTLGGTVVCNHFTLYLHRWNAKNTRVSWDQFAREWNRPVHVFLLRHVYHSSISFMKVNKHTATLITFFISACVHELVMWCLFKKLRGYLLILQMCQLPVRVFLVLIDTMDLLAKFHSRSWSN